MQLPDNLAGTWQILDIRYTSPRTGKWKSVPYAHFDGFTITLSEKWKTHLPLQGEFYKIDYKSNTLVVLCNPANTIRVTLERMVLVPAGTPVIPK